MKLIGPVIGSNGWIEQIDLLPYFFRLTIDSATEFLFGESVNSQLRLVPGYQTSKLGSKEERFATAFESGQMALATQSRFMDAWWLYDSLEFRNRAKLFTILLTILSNSRSPRACGRKSRIRTAEARSSASFLRR